MPLHNFPKLPSINRFEELPKDASHILHARSFSVPPNAPARIEPIPSGKNANPMYVPLLAGRREARDVVVVARLLGEFAQRDHCKREVNCINRGKDGQNREGHHGD